MNKAYLITGGNLGNKSQTLKKAQELISENAGFILKSSAVYETEAWGKTNQPSFYNQIHYIETPLSAVELLAAILEIERQMGRIRTVRNAARIIDIDILFYNDEVIEIPGLVIPHQEIANRRFVLKPLLEIAPDYLHPKLKKKIRDIEKMCIDQLTVTKLK